MDKKLLKGAMVLALLLSCFTLHAQNTVIPEGKYIRELKKIVQHKKVKSAMKIIEDLETKTINNMVLLTEIPAPPFKETERAKKFKEMLATAGADSVWIDKAGNVLALCRGKKGNKTVVLDAHMDTVFPEGTNVTVKKEGETYSAPGIGDNTRAMAMLLTVLKAMDKVDIQTDADIVFVGTVGEEGLGDLRGTKHLFSNASDIKIDSWVSIDGGSTGRIINGGLGSKRYKVIFKGKGGHSWSAFGLANPHHVLGKAIDIFVEEAIEYTRGEGPKTSFNIGKIGGGTSVNSIPFESWMEVDMRSLDPKRLLEIDSIFKASMHKAVAAYNTSGISGKVTLEVEKIGDRPSGILPEGTAVVQRAIAAATFLNITPKLETGSTNSNIPIALNIPSITISRGGKNRGAHSLEESWTNTDGAKNIKLALLILLGEAGLTTN